MMALSSDDLVKITHAAASNIAVEDIGIEVSDEVLETYSKVLAEINAADGRTMLTLPNEWPDDSFDDLIDNTYAAWGAPPSLKDTQPTLVSKAVEERRFTLGPMYIPNIRDAHSEWTDGEELQKAVWEYVRKGDRRIRLQHDRDKVAGEFVEIMAWPYEVEVPIVMKDSSQKTMKFPADTVFLGVIWEPWAWELVKDGKLRGYSIGGRAERLLADLPEE